MAARARGRRVRLRLRRGDAVPVSPRNCLRTSVRDAALRVTLFQQRAGSIGAGSLEGILDASALHATQALRRSQFFGHRGN